MDKHNMSVNEEKTQTLIQGEKNKDVPCVIGINGDVGGTLDASYYKGCGERQGIERDVVAVDMGAGKSACGIHKEQSPTLSTTHYGEPVVAYGLDRASFNQGKNAQFDFCVEEEVSPPIVARGPGGGNDGTVGALCARDYKGVGSQYVTEGKVIIQGNRD